MGVVFHFLNVGSGDCTIVHFPERERSDGKKNAERIMMVDIHHHQNDEEYENIIDYYKRNFKKHDGTVRPVFRFVCTHPHQDHICGLKKLLDDPDINILNFWDLKHSFEPEDFDHYLSHQDDWNAYKTLRGGNSPATLIVTSREDTPRLFWNDDEDRIVVLSPSASLTKDAHYKQDGTLITPHEVEIDEMSYALMIKINQRKVILAGDGHAAPCWNDIYDNCKADMEKCAILKAGHHGQEAGFHEEAVKLISPQLVIVSNSKEQDKQYGAEDLYSKAAPDALILKTSDSGTIVVDVPFKTGEPITYSTAK